MKKWILVSTGAVFIFTLCFILHAQETATSVQGGAISLTDTNVDWNSMSDLEVELKAVESVPPMPANSLPSAGTFWSAQHAPGTAEEWPPLPTSFGMSAWSLGDDGVFLLSDLNHVYASPKLSKNATTTSSGTMMTMDNVDLNPNDGSGTNDGGSGGSFSPMFSPGGEFGTNLWLEITNLTNYTADFMASNTIADVEYEVQSRADLVQGNWNSEGFFYGSEITNWTPTSAEATNYPNLFYRIRSWQSSDGSGLPDWWQIKYFGTTGVDPYADPDGDGWNNLQEFQNGTDPTVFNTPPTPQGVTVTYNAANGTATVSWLPSPGAVTGYKVTFGDIYGNTVYTVSSNVLSLTESVYNGTWDFSNDGPNAFTGFQVEADYAGGHAVVGDEQSLEASSPDNVHVIPGPAGLTYLAADVAALPAGTTAIRLARGDEWGDANTITNFDVPLSAFTNGLYLLPTGNVDSPSDEYDQWWVETIANGSANSAANLVSYGAYVDGSLFPSYLDGRVQLKQNLIFQLRAATENSPFEFTEINLVSDNYVDSILYPNNYVYSGFYQLDDAYASSYGPDYTANGTVDPYWPFHDNVRYRNFVFNSTNLTTYGSLNTGAGYDYHYTSLNAGMILLHPLTFEFQIQTNYSSMLATNQTRWLFTYPLALNTSLNESLIGFVTNSSGGWTFASSFHNYWGLPFVSAKLAYNNSSTTTLNPGDSSSTGGYVYEEAAQPQFSTVEYDFWDSSPVPGSTGFSPTNKSDLLIAPVDSSIQVNGYAKLSVQNGYSGVYGYLGQYFDKAYKITNGVVTTNTTGVLSPYGNFFATQGGSAALVTMPDVDTGARGTCTVYCVSMNVDANHDGNMDLSFNGPDATSQASPMEFWADNNYDRFTLDADDGTYYDDDVPVSSPDANSPYTGQPTPDYNYLDGSGHRVISCERDLQDFARLWVAGITTNLLAALPSGSTITLSWGDAGSPNPNNPTIDLFSAADADGGIGYLTNSDTAFAQADPLSCPYIGRLAPGGSIQLNTIQFANNWAGNHFIWCGVSNGTGGLNLTIKDGSGNVLAQTTAYIQIQDIKQMYERWTVGENPSKAPKSVAVKAVDGVTTAFEYTPPQDTNTPYILYVHGWNMETWEKDRFAESAFKRLYWQGYHGRFGVFRWPTTYGFTGNFWQALTDTYNFNNGESNAWNSAAGLVNKLNGLNTEYPGHVYILAHSMGNVVAGEALRLAAQNGDGQLVNTYAASQGALSAHSYDATVTTPYLLPFSYQYPSGLLSYLGTMNYGPFAPDIYGNRLTNNVAAVGRRINFYNTNDFALATPRWGFDQLLKPNHPYIYTGPIPDSAPWNKFAILLDDGATNMLDIVNNVSDLYTVLAYAAPSYSTALGATPITTFGSVNLGSTINPIWPPDSSGNNYTEHFWHSAEFRGDAWQEWNYWQTLLRSSTLGFNISNP